MASKLTGYHKITQSGETFRYKQHKIEAKEKTKIEAVYQIPDRGKEAAVDDDEDPDDDDDEEDA